MFYRQKLLLGLLETFGGELPSTDFQKYLFLYTRLCQRDKSYEFVPYKFGCFSFQSYADKSKLIESGLLEDSSEWKLAKSRKKHVNQLNKGEDKKLVLFRKRYEHLKGKELLQHVYRSYPYYAIKSLVAEEILTEEEFQKVKKLNVKKRKPLFATIGYEGITVEQYLNKLIENDVRLLIDVRKNPLSRKFGFSKSKMSDLLNKMGIEYLHMPALGIVSDKRQKLETKKDYERLFSEYEKTVLVDQVDEVSNLFNIYLDKKKVAITCFEECHTMCHRNNVAEAVADLASEDFKVVHL